MNEQVNQRITELADWRGPMLAEVRAAVRAADPEIVEEFKWMGTPSWSLDGMIAVADAYKKKVLVTFAYGAALPDPDKLFNAGYGGATRRAIEIFEGDTLNAPALTRLVQAAIAHNRAHLKKNAPARSRPKAAKAT